MTQEQEPVQEKPATNNQARDQLTQDLEAIKAPIARPELSELRQENSSSPETNNFLQWAQENGVNISSTEVAKQVLDDPDLFNTPLRSLLGKLGISMEQARSLGVQFKKELTKVTGERFREYIKETDWRSRLQSENLAVDFESSSETLNSAQLSGELAKILASADIEFRQGAIWNMATSTESEWVAKFIKAGSGAGSEYIMKNEMQQYHQAKEVFGDEFFLKQIAVELKDKGTPLLLQEKLDLERWRPMGAHNEEIYDQITEAVQQNPQNKAILGDFLEKIRQLETQDGLILDFSGDNVVYQVDEKGLLNIKILDYGCTKAETDDPDRVASLHKHADTIKMILQ